MIVTFALNGSSVVPPSYEMNVANFTHSKSSVPLIAIPKWILTELKFLVVSRVRR